MNKLKNILIIFLILSVILSINIVSANELNVTDNFRSSDLNQPLDSDVSLEIMEEYEVESNQLEEISSSGNEDSDNYVIYVGTNNESGNGSLENPFSTFDLACNDISLGKNNVTINVLDGTYYLGSDLVFNCTNLHIIGLESNVIIKNMYPNNKHDGINSQESFDLIDNQGNFTISNIMIDTSSLSYTSNLASGYYFFICKGTPNMVTFNNCTFLNYGMQPINSHKDYRYKYYLFNNCEFISTMDAKLGNKMTGILMNYATFKYCTFYFGKATQDPFTAQAVSSKTTVPLFDDCWLGINSIPNNFYNSQGKFLGYNITRYAIFDISENYLGNNTYEIIGKLAWNDSTTDGIENFNPMVVNLTSTTGNIPTIAILENGTFKVIYTSTEFNHKITATLDNEIQTIEFQSINISLDAPSITYGDEQNITVTLPTEYNGIVYVTVNNKTYKKDVEFTNVVTIDISDVLLAGTYDVNVTFVDKIDNETCAIYGFNTTTITVSKVSNYEFDATVTDSIYLGDNATVTLNLPNDANGTVSIKIGENEAIIFNVNDVININNFVAGDNVVNITYDGNEKYDSKSILKNVVASAKTTTITTANVTTTYNVAKDLVVTLSANGEVLANKTINVVVGIINENLTTNASGQVSIDVSTLAPNTYVANIAFAGDDAYVKSNATAKVIINKIASSLTAPKVSTIYNVAKKLVITLKDVNGNILANKKVSVKVGSISKTLTTNTKGQVAVDISKLTPKTYTAKFTFAKDTIYEDSSNTAKVTVSKATPKIIAKKTTFKAKTKTKKYTITLKDNKGKVIKKAKVTLKVKGKTYKATTNSKGKATFKITKLSKKGKHTSTIKFAGNNLYKAVTKKGIKLTVKK